MLGIIFGYIAEPLLYAIWIGVLVELLILVGLKWYYSRDQR